MNVNECNVLCSDGGTPLCACLCVKAVTFKISHTCVIPSPLSQPHPAVWFPGSVTTATRKAHSLKERKLGAGLSLVHVIEQKCTEGGKKSSYPQMPVSCGAFSYLVTNHIFHHLPFPTPVYLLLDVHCPWERLSLWGVASSSSHLVLGKLGYINNISAQNISATSGPGWREIVA